MGGAGHVPAGGGGDRAARGQVREGAEERDLVVPPGRGGVGQGARSGQAVPRGPDGDRGHGDRAQRRADGARPGRRQGADRALGRRADGAHAALLRPGAGARPQGPARDHAGQGLRRGLRRVSRRDRQDPRRGPQAARRRARGRGDRRRRLRRGRDQGLRRHQRPAPARRRRAGADPADPHLPLADLLGDPVLHRAGRGGLLARLRLPAGRGRRDDQRPVGRHPARARVRGGHGLCAAAGLALPRGAAPPRRQARRDARGAAQRRPRDPGLGPDRDGGVAHARPRRRQRHGGARADRGDGRLRRDDLHAHHAARRAHGLRPRRVLAVRAARPVVGRPSGPHQRTARALQPPDRRDARLLAPRRRARRGRAAPCRRGDDARAARAVRRMGGPRHRTDERQLVPR